MNQDILTDQMKHLVTPEIAAQYQNVPRLGSRLFRWEQVHEFILPDNGPLVWKIRDHVVATGVVEFRQYLVRQPHLLLETKVINDAARQWP